MILKIKTTTWQAMSDLAKDIFWNNPHVRVYTYSQRMELVGKKMKMVEVGHFIGD